MEKKINQSKYRFLSGVTIRNYNQLYTNGIHLFNCGRIALPIIEIAQQIQDQKDGFTIQEISNRLSDKPYSKLQIKIEIVDGSIDYLYRCGLIEKINTSIE